MGAYDKFRKADVMGVRAYILPGIHILQVRRSEQSQSKHPQRKGQEKTVIEFKIIESDNPDMKPGRTCALVEVETSAGYFGNVLAYVAGMLGYGVDEFRDDPAFDDVFQSVFGPDQITTDMLVKCTAQQVAKQDGEPYTAKTWDPVEAKDYKQYGLIAPDGAYTGAAVAAVEEEAEAA